MNWFWKKYYRAVIVLLCFLAVCAAIFVNYEKSTRLDLPDCNSVYDIKNIPKAYELDDYILTTEGMDYEIVHKETGAKRKLLNDPFDDRHYIISCVETDRNKIYYGLDGYGFYCYDADKDLTTVLYKDNTLRWKSSVIKLFDVVVFQKAITSTEKETNVSHYLIYNGNLIIVTNRNITIYNGKSERELLKGNYRVDRFKDGIMELSTFTKDSEGNSLKTKYRYEIETGEFLKVGEDNLGK